MSEFLNKIQKIKSSKPYIDYHNYHQGNIFGITKTSRWELMHSNFIAWALHPDSSHALKLYPLYQFVRSIGCVQDNADNTTARKLDPALLYKFYGDDFIVDATIEREAPVPDGKNTKHIDLVIEIITKEKILPIIIEVKVDSPENGKNKDQTIVYYDWGEKEAYPDRTIYFDPIYIFLYPEYKETKQKSDKYIRMTFQELVDNVLAPSSAKCGDVVSRNNYKQYLQSLSFQVDNEKGGRAMAICPEEKKILDEFVAQNRSLLLEVLLEYDDLPSSVRTAISSTLTKDTSQYKFLGNTYGKGKLVLAVVKQYVEDHPADTFTDLQVAFPDNLQGGKGVVRLDSSVKPEEKGIGGKKRYFVKASEIITLPSSGEKVLVSIDWGIGNIEKFIEQATKLGYTISTD